MKFEYLPRAILCNNLIKNIPEIKKYEKELAKNSATTKSTSKTFTPEFIRQVQKDILGWDPEIIF